MVKSNNYYFIVDKEYGDSHSFINGMLIKYIIPNSDKSIIYYAKRNEVGKINEDFVNDFDFLVESSYRRVGLERLFFSLAAFFGYFRYFCFGKCNIFIRNELLVLLFFSILKFFLKDRVNIIFQNSFPHECNPNLKITFKEFFAKKIMSFSLKMVDEIILVSESAVSRIREYKLKKDCLIKVIPLCSDFDIIDKDFNRSTNQIKFVYSGTFSSYRQLDKVIRSFYKLSFLTADSNKWVFDLYGGSKDEFLKNYPFVHDEVNYLVGINRLNFFGKLSRSQLEKSLINYHVGINLIPPLDIYKESSSTKLGEYLSKGLAVLSSNEIPYHEKIHSISEIGWLCDFCEDSICMSLYNILSMDDFYFSNLSYNSKKVACDFLSYRNYIEVFYG